MKLIYNCLLLGFFVLFSCVDSQAQSLKLGVTVSGNISSELQGNWGTYFKENGLFRNIFLGAGVFANKQFSERLFAEVEVGFTSIGERIAPFSVFEETNDLTSRELFVQPKEFLRAIDLKATMGWNFWKNMNISAGVAGTKYILFHSSGLNLVSNGRNYVGLSEERYPIFGNPSNPLIVSGLIEPSWTFNHKDKPLCIAGLSFMTTPWTRGVNRSRLTLSLRYFLISQKM